MSSKAEKESRLALLLSKLNGASHAVARQLNLAIRDIREQLERKIRVLNKYSVQADQLWQQLLADNLPNRSELERLLTSSLNASDDLARELHPRLSQEIYVRWHRSPTPGMRFVRTCLWDRPKPPGRFDLPGRECLGFAFDSSAVCTRVFFIRLDLTADGTREWLPDDFVSGAIDPQSIAPARMASAPTLQFSSVDVIKQEEFGREEVRQHFQKLAERASQLAEVASAKVAAEAALAEIAEQVAYLKTIKTNPEVKQAIDHAETELARLRRDIVLADLKRCNVKQSLNSLGHVRQQSERLMGTLYVEAQRLAAAKPRSYLESLFDLRRN